MNPTRHVVWLLAWSLTVSAQEPPKPDADPKPSGGGEQSFKLGDASEPLRIAAQYANTERVGAVDIFTASGTVFAWQGDKKAPTFQLTCESLVVWRTDTDRNDPTTGKPIQRTEFYAERDVRFQRRREVLFGQRMYFDLDANHGLIDQARYTSQIERAGADGGTSTGKLRVIPLSIRARQFRVLNDKRSLAQDASFSTSSFGDPSYRFQASNIILDSEVDPRTGTRTLRTLHSRSVPRLIEPHGHNDVPLFFFPYLALTREDDFIVKRIEAGNDGQFGTFLFTRFGQRIGNWGSWLLDVDVSSDRGVGIGPGAKYETFDPWSNKYKGEFHAYFIRDQLFDPDGEGKTEESGAPVPRQNRYRVRWQHRHEFPDKLRLDLEVSKQSDPGFLREFFERELREDKEQETIAYLRKQVDNHQASVLFKYELNDFITTTEYLPQLRIDTLSEPVYDGNKVLRNLYWTQSTQLAYLRRQIAGNLTRVLVDEATGEERLVDLGKDPDDGRDQVRADSAHELAYPFALGPIRFNPFLGARPGYFSDPIEGGGGRFVGSGGVRINTQLHRMYKVHVPALDVSNLQHVITPEIRYFNTFAATKPSEDLFFYDEVDTVDKLHVITFKLMNRLKTRRFDTPRHDAVRFPGLRKPNDEQIGFAKKRQGSIVEFMYFDVELPVFPDADRDNGGRTVGDMDLEYRWDIRRWLSLSMDAEVRFEKGESERRRTGEEDDERSGRRRRASDDLEDRIGVEEEDLTDPIGAGLKSFNASLLITNPDADYPRWSLRPGFRHAAEISSAPFLDATFALNPKWELGARVDYELREGGRLSFGELRLRRYLDRFVVDFVVEREEGEVRGDDQTSFKIRFRLREQVPDDNNSEQYDDDPQTPDEKNRPSLLESIGGTPPPKQPAAGTAAGDRK